MTSPTRPTPVDQDTVNDEDAPITETFEDLGVPDDIISLLADDGIDTPFPIQIMTIPDAMSGRDVAGKAQTGSGKTLAFGIPMIERTTKAAKKRPRALVLVPTRELAGQVAAALRPLAEARSLTLEAFYGGIAIGPQIEAAARGIDIVVATPGRIIDLLNRRAMSASDLGIVVLDEADRMADMGFLPQVQKILRQVDGTHQTLLFSATLDSAVDTLVKRYMNDPIFHEVESRSVTVEEMDHRFVTVTHDQKLKVAVRICQAYDRVIAFTNTKHAADRLASDLVRSGIAAKAIHGDLPQNKREKALQAFGAGKIHVLVATDVAARGIHVDSIDVVLHYEPPEDHKSYLHRSGRTARAGEDGLAITLVLWSEQHEIRRLQRRIGVDQGIVEMDANDVRLDDLASFKPSRAKRRRSTGPFTKRAPRSLKARKKH